PQYPRFTPEMKRTHKILIPQMAPTHFIMIAEVFRQDGYQVEILENGGPEVAQEGLKYVHNDTCYPALLVIGQFIDALKSGRYDLEHTALMITQTGGGCRASNYIHLLRKALVKAGFPGIPVASLNFSGLEKDSGFKFTLPMVRKAIAAVFYGDELMCLANQVRPYENNPGQTDALVAKWQAELCARFAAGNGVSKRDMKRAFGEVAADFAAVPVTPVPRVKVGIVGEIYVKYSPLGNSGLEAFLAEEGCEVNMPGLMGFIQSCIVNGSENIKLNGGSGVVKKVYEVVMDFTTTREKLMVEAIGRFPNLRAPGLFEHTVELHEGFISLGAKMGEGWLLTSEMVELVKSGFPNIVCAQPFGCLPNHVVGKGMISKIRAVSPEANIPPIDYDPSATLVNQENRNKLMLAVGKERLEDTAAPAGMNAAAPAGKLVKTGA
ncbi:MAG: 2-hydroxyacyl-CoA dehydratase, partial [Acidobacteriota bacterium]|nr:2-hydroxyacyl-CoA dehydratase [Acidobacteriota bacterium]